ncbi:MAG: DUF4422 domain-containing protein [Lachnospiraceae bacterium]|nr:DUF4422 domain-containing protein [Lachnospiraceae bacterium]
MQIEKLELENGEEIAIYGARMVAMSVYHAIRALYPQCRVIAFLVTSRVGNRAEIDGIPVMELKDFSKKQVKILLAVQDNYHREIGAELEKRGMLHYIPINAKLEAALMERYYQEVEELPFLHSLKKGTEKADLAVYVSKFHGDKPLKEQWEPATWMHPIQAGAALTESSVAQLKDNQGENISRKNGNYSELTSTYWIGKHGTAEYLGLYHYRRMLDITEEDLYRLRENKVDAVLSYPAIYYPNIWTHHEYYLKEGDWAAMVQALQEQAPEYARDLPELFYGKFFLNHNMLVAQKKVFREYCDWLFPILERTEELSEPRGWERADRYIGYLGENLTTLYFLYNQRNLNLVYTGRRMRI